MTTETLIFLLRGGHINMPDRLAQGIWPHPPLQFEDVVRTLADYLSNFRETEWFPTEPTVLSQGTFVPDEGNIKRLEPGKYLYKSVAANPYDPRKVSAAGEVIFNNSEDAARHYLRWDLHLPGDLDGWKVAA